LKESDNLKKEKDNLVSMKSIAFYNLGVEFEHIGDLARSLDAYKRGYITAVK
jgi:hypothetical protein